MKLRDIEDWIKSLPTEFLEYEVVVAQKGMLTEDHTYRLDMPIIILDVDQDNDEALFFIEPKDNEDNE